MSGLDRVCNAFKIAKEAIATRLHRFVEVVSDPNPRSKVTNESKHKVNEDSKLKKRFFQVEDFDDGLYTESSIEIDSEFRAPNYAELKAIIYIQHEIQKQFVTLKECERFTDIKSYATLTKKEWESKMDEFQNIIAPCIMNLCKILKEYANKLSKTKYAENNIEQISQIKNYWAFDAYARMKKIIDTFDQILDYATKTNFNYGMPFVKNDKGDKLFLRTTIFGNVRKEFKGISYNKSIAYEDKFWCDAKMLELNEYITLIEDFLDGNIKIFSEEDKKIVKDKVNTFLDRIEDILKESSEGRRLENGKISKNGVLDENLIKKVAEVTNDFGTKMEDNWALTEKLRNINKIANMLLSEMGEVTM